MMRRQPIFFILRLSWVFLIGAPVSSGTIKIPPAIAAGIISRPLTFDKWDTLSVDINAIRAWLDASNSRLMRINRTDDVSCPIRFYIPIAPDSYSSPHPNIVDLEGQLNSMNFGNMFKIAEQLNFCKSPKYPQGHTFPRGQVFGCTNKYLGQSVFGYISVINDDIDYDDITVVHEYGHLAGLDHSVDPAHIMFGNLQPGTTAAMNVIHQGECLKLINGPLPK
jgi:hypothetical protein